MKSRKVLIDCDIAVIIGWAIVLVGGGWTEF
jgi:hypothetical protein